MRSMSSSGMPWQWSILINYSITTETFESILMTGLLPIKREPNIYKLGISKGKLKGAIIATGPNGQRYP